MADSGVSLRTLIALGIGIAAGWAARSLADSPQGAGVKLLEIAMNAKERISRWAAVERERLEDMVAEARSKAEPKIVSLNGTGNGSGRKSGQRAHQRTETSAGEA